MSLFVELMQFLVARKKYWLWPMLLVVFLIGGLVVATQGTAVAPFIYTIF